MAPKSPAPAPVPPYVKATEALRAKLRAAHPGIGEGWPKFAATAAAPAARVTKATELARFAKEAKGSRFPGPATKPTRKTKNKSRP